jgi:protein O-mannosyl-transferase
MPSDHVPSTDRLRPWVFSAILGGLVLLCYWPALRGGMLWDDPAHVTTLELRSWAGLGRIWSELGATQQYYPVLHSAFWIEHRLWGDATLGYHLVNVLLHVAACCLLVRALHRLGSLGSAAAPESDRTIPAATAWLAAILFAVHPVCVESVAWISEQKNTLSLVFYFLAGLAWLDFHAQRKKHAYALATLCFLLALGTKTVTATLPAALLVVLWWRNGKLSWRRDVVPLLPWFLLAAVAGLFTAWVERRLIGAEGSGFALTLGERVLLAGRVVWFYAGKLAWPFDLMFIYPRWNVAVAAPGWFGYLAGVGLLTAGLWLIRRRARGPLAGWLFFAGSLFPALGFFNVYPFIFSYVADHFQYLASLGLLVVVAAGVTHWLAGVPSRWRPAGWLLVALFVAGLGRLTNLQCRIYSDANTLYRDTLAVNPDCWMAHNNLGLLLSTTPAGIPEAIQHFEEAMRLWPDYPEAHNNLGFLLAKQPGRQAEAMAHFEQALRLQPHFAEAHSNLANILVTLDGRLAEALAHYQQALRANPKQAEVHLYYANALANLPGREREALAHYEEAVRLEPDYVEAHYKFGVLLARRGLVEQARQHLEKVLELDTNHEDARRNLRLLDQRPRP